MILANFARRIDMHLEELSEGLNSAHGHSAFRWMLEAATLLKEARDLIDPPAAAAPVDRFESSGTPDPAHIPPP